MDVAIRFGYKINIIKGYKFKEQNIFDKYVETMYQMRLKYKKGSPLNLLAKLLMNSLYGKFAMKPYHSVVGMYNTSTEEGRQQLQDMMKSHGETFQDFFEIGDYTVVVRKNVSNITYDHKTEMYNGSDVNIAIGSAITAGGRYYLAPLRLSKEHTLYYSDTDSLVVDKPLDPRLINLEIGFFKLEYIIRRAVFLAPKVYGFVTEEGETVIKVKGVSKKEVSSMTIETLEGLLVKDATSRYLTEISQNKWFKDLMKGEISIDDVAYRLKITSIRCRGADIRDPVLANENLYTNTIKI